LIPVPDYRNVSLWHESAGPLDPRASLVWNDKVDVAIVGAGFTGLWTSYYLQQADPTLRIAVVESEIAGFGASGRNGGWCSALFPTSASELARRFGHHAAHAQYAAMRESVDEVVRVVDSESIDADLIKGGTIVLARSQPQLDRADLEVAESAQFDLGVQLLDAEAATARLAATEVRGATYTPHCAVIHPAKLVRGLAGVVEDRGVTIYERTPATAIEPGQVRTPAATLRADVVVRATEGYTAGLSGLKRKIVPVYSLMIATEPLDEETWAEVGLAQRETFSDGRHLIIYGQRTADGRMVFGGRGAPYHLGSRIKPGYDRAPAIFESLHRALIELFPRLRHARITHRWGGPLGIARDWHASVGLAGGLGWAGGYVGDGVSTTNLAGRTLAALITGTHSPLTTLPWVGHHSPDWEPEPLRWLGTNAGLRAMDWADRAEERTGKGSRLASTVNKVIGQ
jgi:glycine/D-amino acid oxidase-like deaminating enzyme